MKVTKPDMYTALLYLSATAPARNHKYMVVALMLASEKDKVLYTAWYCKSVISNIIVSKQAELRNYHASMLGKVTCNKLFQGNTKENTKRCGGEVRADATLKGGVG